MSSPLASRLREFREEIRRNPRLRWGGLAIVAILFLYMLMLLSDWRRELQLQYQQRATDLYKMAALAGQDQWLGRAREANSMRRDLRWR